MQSAQNQIRKDTEIAALYAKAAAAGYAVSLVRADGFLLDMQGWIGDGIKTELLGFRWHEYIRHKDVKRLLEWIRNPHRTGPIVYSGVCPGAKSAKIALNKISGETTRLLIGATKKPPSK